MKSNVPGELIKNVTDNIFNLFNPLMTIALLKSQVCVTWDACVSVCVSTHQSKQLTGVTAAKGLKSDKQSALVAKMYPKSQPLPGPT